MTGDDSWSLCGRVEAASTGPARVVFDLAETEGASGSTACGCCGRCPGVLRRASVGLGLLGLTGPIVDGDVVRLTVSHRGVGRGAAGLFGLPLAGLAAGAAAGTALAGEAGGIALATVGLAAGLVALRRCAGRLERALCLKACRPPALIGNSAAVRRLG
jgi:hypothetical protein